MEIYDEQMQPLAAPDMALGWMEEAFRSVHHPAVPAIREQWHYEVTAQYSNGGRDVRRVIDVPGMQARNAWEERIPILIYHPFTGEELAQREAEKNRPEMEARMQRIEAAMEGLGGRMEEMFRAMAALREEKGA